jgi:hypothetical protein
MACVAIAVIYSAVKQQFINPGAEQFIEWSAVIHIPPNQVALLVIYFALAVLWTFYFTKNRVKQAAFAYADMLLRSRDILR